MYLWKVVAFQEKIYSHEREKKPCFFPLERACTRSTRTAEREFKNDHTHNTISTASLCFSPPKTREKTLSRALSQRKGDVFFRSTPSLWARSFSRTFSSILKKFYETRAALFCSLSSHAHTNSSFLWRWDDDDVLLLYVLRIHRSESCSCKERGGGFRFIFFFENTDLIYARKKEENCRLWETNETKATASKKLLV